MIGSDKIDFKIDSLHLIKFYATFQSLKKGYLNNCQGVAVFFFHDNLNIVENYFSFLGIVAIANKLNPIIMAKSLISSTGLS